MNDYKHFDRYYSLRAKVIGLQDGGKRAVFRMINPYLANNRFILDIGCGRGMYLIPLCRQGKQVIGLDLNADNVNLLQNSGYSVYQCDCVENIPNRWGYFDAVICSEILEHLTDEQTFRLIENIRKVLIKGGILIVTVPYREYLENNTVVCPHCHNIFHRDGHLKSYNDVKELLYYFNNTDWQLVKEYVVYSQLNQLRAPLILYRLLSVIRPKFTGNLICIFIKK
ncbi:MAG TPA: hypothetical protein DCY27_05420 [Desulfobacterales bacterium]|nr:hypothetical protein [Desulfobacterales bacterium]